MDGVVLEETVEIAVTEEMAAVVVVVVDNEDNDDDGSGVQEEMTTTGEAADVTDTVTGVVTLG